MRRGHTRLLGALGVAACLLVPASAHGAPEPLPAGTNDPGGFWNIVPPGQNGFESAADAAAFRADGTRPPHQIDQNDVYANLVYAAPGLKKSQIPDFFKDASFGVEPDEVERRYTPDCAVVSPPSASSSACDQVTIVRDGFGIPHVYGEGRAGLMFGLGYVTAEDRLFLADVLRHAGRAQLSSFAGGASSNRSQDVDTWSSAPYAGDHELQLQFDRAEELYGQLGVQVQEDATNYVDGINQFIAESRLDPAGKLDAKYAGTNHPEGPEPWKVTDVIATGSLVAGIFGKGGGGEVRAATSLQKAKEVLGRRKGRMVWRDFRSADDPEAPTTVRGKEFPYRTPPKGKGKGKARGKAMPDPGSVESVPTEVETTGGGETRSRGSGGRPAGALEGLRELDGGSNALLVSKREARGKHPIAVFGPQTGYFAPQLLMEQDAHAPAGPEGPAIDARGVAFVGTNLYVQLGRGRDYAWSATSAGQDIIDTFAVRLCEPDGPKPTKESMHYRWNRKCLPIEVLEQTNEWQPSVADDTPAGTQTLRAYRTKAGLVTHRATMNGKPIAYTKLRATYFHEVDAAGAFAAWNSPDEIKSAKDFFDAGALNDLTFNWFYVDRKKIAYFNSGANMTRARNTHPNFPVKAKPKLMWKGFDEELMTFRRDPPRTHPQVIDQRFLTSWNNKQADGYRDDAIHGYTSIYRVKPLDDRIREGIRGKRKMTLVELIDAMEDAGTVDLRGDAVVPLALRAISKGSRAGARNARRDRELRRAMRLLRRWSKGGAHRLDADDDGAYDHAEAVRIIDAWWPLLVRAQFRPTLGKGLFATLVGSSIHDAPGSVGSAFNHTFYGFVHKDLRELLGRKVEGSYSRVYCGGGKLDRCSKRLAKTLVKAFETTPEELYGDEGCTLNNGTEASAQMCEDAVDARDVLAAPVGPFHWINRPTFQQAVQIEGR